jgi:hypothetical protein
LRNPGLNGRSAGNSTLASNFVSMTRRTMSSATRTALPVIIMVSLVPGKRGKYKMFIYDIVGFEAVTGQVIGVDDVITKHPWLAVQLHTVEGCGRCLIRHFTRRVLYITTHSLVRVVQRWQARNLQDLIKVINTITIVAIKHIVKVDDGLTDNWCKTPLEGIRVPFPNNSSVMVLK